MGTTDGVRLSRREVVAGTAGALAVAGAAGGSSGAVPLVLGSGSHRYECVHDWLTPPENIRWGDTHGVAQDSAGRIYIAHTVHPESPSGDAIVVFDRSGEYLSSWGARFRNGAHGLDIRKEGSVEFIYHCDVANRLVVKTTLDGNVVWEKGAPDEWAAYRAGAPFIPTNVAFSPNGEFYVADGYGSDWIHQYDVRGTYIRTFGGKGSEAGKVAQPHGIWVDTRGSEPTVVVADRANSRLQYFSLDGKHIRFDRDGMRQPCHFHIRDGELLVPDLKSVVTLLDEKNKVIVQLGDGDPSTLRGRPRAEFIAGRFVHPHSAKFLQNGDILVVEWVPIGRVTLLRKLA